MAALVNVRFSDSSIGTFHLKPPDRRFVIDRVLSYKLIPYEYPEIPHRAATTTNDQSLGFINGYLVTYAGHTTIPHTEISMHTYSIHDHQYVSIAELSTILPENAIRRLKDHSRRSYPDDILIVRTTQSKILMNALVSNASVKKHTARAILVRAPVLSHILKNANVSLSQ
jgi:hypothetical protein